MSPRSCNGSNNSPNTTVNSCTWRPCPRGRVMLRALWQIAGSNQVLASFNGKSFDWPCIHDRSTLHHIGAESRTGLIHCDLLHHARRRWKDRLPNCRLQTLERYVCGRRRSGDIPGSEIPMAYHDFVRSGNTRQLESILHHNALDLVTLVELAVRVVRSGATISGRGLAGAKKIPKTISATMTPARYARKV